ncbi:MAG: response regulator transcription factor [Chloroflexota bacterium]|nr:response regulator transcription factor [Chloroflexota bacterium]
MAVSILLADDHHVVRQGLRTLLEAQVDFHVVGEAADGLEAVRLVERFKPNVLVVDLMMPGINGIEVACQVKSRSPQTRVVVLSMHANEAYVLEALQCGASAYVLKESTAEELVRAIRAVAAGRHYLSPPLSERAIEAYTQKIAGDAALDLYETLTHREHEVLHLAAEGRTTSEIAERLSISPRTAETHRTNLMRKLGLHSQTELVRYALQRGILPPE